MRSHLALLAFVVCVVASSQTRFPPDVAPFVSVDARTVVLNHVRVIDGTGAAPKEDQTVLIADGKIQSVSPASSTQAPSGAQVLDRTGYSVIPGLVGMHDHLYYTGSAALQFRNGRIEEPGFLAAELPYTAPRLYLAAGVTTMRTTGSVEPYTDLKIKHRIDAGLMPGPALDTSAPYLEGPHTRFAQMHELTGPEDARHLVDYWASAGMTSFKAYMNITRDELGAAIQQAHTHRMKLTGHLCSVTWPEAIALGIDDLEHGPVFADTEFVSGKKADECPNGGAASWSTLAIDSPQIKALIDNLVSHHVAVTSTLPVFEASVPLRPQLQPRVLQSMSTESAQSYLTERAQIPTTSPMASLLRKEMDFELAFAKAGGMLLAGPDPTGNGGVLPGFGDQREIELLVEAGFTPLQAIHIATENGAVYLGRQDRIGTIAPGKQADLVLIKGDPSTKIEDIENVETIFKAGIGYDSQKLIDSVKGQVGIR
ncbi:amidohydrolase family protein [Occallatibacter savannae]|uniref:amidohydrolase family protein n=1 Tax=Occallatibacter savannae TaxID=1002691 RepID=UPI000D69E5C1|nr:amidohydrolase family protein [Occallatibacter savannae]